jgi:hypothetical protein
MRIARSCAVAALLFSASCVDDSVVAAVIDVSAYEAVLRMNRQPAAREQALVASMPLAWPRDDGDVPAWQAQYMAVPEALRLTAAQLPAPAEPFPPGVFPATMRLMPDADLRASGASAWHAFSRVHVTADGRNALLYYERRCGNACGAGEYVWLERESARHPWGVRQVIARWMS